MFNNDYHNSAIRLAKLLAIKDGIVLTGSFSSSPKWPSCSISNLLKQQPKKDRRSIQRKYRKIKRFVKKKYDIETLCPKLSSDYVKHHYIDRARKILKSNRKKLLSSNSK